MPERRRVWRWATALVVGSLPVVSAAPPVLAAGAEHAGRTLTGADPGGSGPLSVPVAGFPTAGDAPPTSPPDAVEAGARLLAAGVSTGRSLVMGGLLLAVAVSCLRWSRRRSHPRGPRS